MEINGKIYLSVVFKGSDEKEDGNKFCFEDFAKEVSTLRNETYIFECDPSL